MAHSSIRLYLIEGYFFGETNIKYLFGAKNVKVYAILMCACIIFGSLQEVELVWNMADLMVVPNIIGLLALTKVVLEVKDDYYDNFTE